MHCVSRVGDIVGKMWMDYMKKYLMWFLKVLIKQGESYVKR